MAHPGSRRGPPPGRRWGSEAARRCLAQQGLSADELKAHFDKPGSKDDNGLAGSWTFDNLGKLDAAAKEVMGQAGPEPPYRERLGLQAR